MCILAKQDAITYQDAFTLDTYTPPTLTNLSAERYSIRPSDTGGADILTADNTGEYVRFSFTLTPGVITGYSSNSWRLDVKATSGSGTTKSKNSACTGTTSGITKTNDTTIFPSASYTFDPKEDWTFTFTITDKVTGTSYSTQVSKAVSILNVESGGVAVGGFLSTGSAFTNNNILRGTGNPTQLVTNNGGIETSSWADGTWSSASGGDGKLTLIQTPDNPDGVLTGFSISGNTSGNKDVGQANVPLTKGQAYTASCWARVQSGSAKLQVRIYSRAPTSALAATAINGVTVNSTAWQHLSGGFTIAASNTGTSFTALFGITGSGSTLEICGFKIEKGSIANPVWTPAPQDHAEVTPFSQPKRFETSDDCGAILRGGLWDGRGYRMDYVNNTQMIDITNTSFAPYSETRMPMISRVGPIVFFEGGVKCTKTTAVIDTDGIVLCTLPGWARPRVEVSQLSQGYSTNIYWLFIDTDGQVWIRRNQQAGSYTTIPANGQLTFSATWLAADAAPPLPSIT